MLSSDTTPPPPPVKISSEIEEETLNAVGHDLLLFLGAAVVVEPLGKILGVTPVLLYLLLGFVAGPYGMSLFQSGTDVNSEIGDFGILFLLFVEGLNLSPERLRSLASFFSLGAIQLLVSVSLIFFGLFFGGPYLLPIIQRDRIPIDPQMVQLLAERPVVAFCVAAAGALSSSAFVLPILKERNWEKSPDGIAALSILLLQDLAVAPLLVLIPLIADTGSGVAQDPTALGILIAKATIGFGSVLVAASVILRRIFTLVATFGSSQTFIAASLLVAVGMGIIADQLGLSATTGAFAAGVLLAESGYRAQIEADIKPFEGVLLGVFFVTAGASLDPATVLSEWPTLLAGIMSFIAVKFGILLLAGISTFGLTRVQAIRVAILLSGGGEFAFVVFKLASNLGVLNESLAQVLTASVVISMSCTPLLGEAAEYFSNYADRLEERHDPTRKLARNNLDDPYVEFDIKISDESTIQEAFELFDEDGNGTVSVEELQKVLIRPGTPDMLFSYEEARSVLRRFDQNGDDELELDEFATLWTSKRRPTADEAKREKLQALDDDMSHATVVCGYGEVGQAVCANLQGPYVAFSRDPKRISLGVLQGAKVIYGNGASPALAKSVGVERPDAIVVCFAEEEKALETTLRMREEFPDAPIFVRAARADHVDELKAAGATSVIVEKVKTAESFANLVGLRNVKEQVQRVVNDITDEALDVPFSEEELTKLCYTHDVDPTELGRLYELFVTSLNRNEQGQVQLAELRDELVRRSNTPLDDATLQRWSKTDELLSKWVTDATETQWVSFPEFVEFAARK